MKQRKVLGVIGGLGPMATAYYMELVTRMTLAHRDQDHLEMLVHSVPSIPDRTGYILGRTRDDPLPPMAAVGRKLVDQGAGCIAIPCVTAHYFYRELQARLPVPVLNSLRQTAAYLQTQGIRTAGVMATDGTIAAGLFTRELEAAGITPVLPSARRQADVMHLIYENIKAGCPVEPERFHGAAGELFDRGAQAVILGCTELSLLKRDFSLGRGFLDVMEVLASSAIQACGADVKEEYCSLISE